MIIRGNTLIHMLNGHLMSVVIDDDAKRQGDEGRDWGAGACGSADEGGVSEFPAEGIVVRYISVSGSTSMTSAVALHLCSTAKLRFLE